VKASVPGIPQVVEVPQGAPVGKDVKEAQEFPVNPTRGRRDTGQKGVCGALPVGIASRYRATLARAVVSRSLLTSGPRSCHVCEVVAAELVGAGNVNDQMPTVTKVGVLDEQITATSLAVGFAQRQYVVALLGQARVMAYLLQRIQDRLVGILRSARVLLAGVELITVRVDDVPISRADERQRRLVAVLA
jgi:hypothetical protein